MAKLMRLQKATIFWILFFSLGQLFGSVLVPFWSSGAFEWTSGRGMVPASFWQDQNIMGLLHALCTHPGFFSYMFTIAILLGPGLWLERRLGSRLYFGMIAVSLVSATIVLVFGLFASNSDYYIALIVPWIVLICGILFYGKSRLFFLSIRIPIALLFAVPLFPGSLVLLLISLKGSLQVFLLAGALLTAVLYLYGAGKMAFWQQIDNEPRLWYMPPQNQERSERRMLSVLQSQNPHGLSGKLLAGSKSQPERNPLAEKQGLAGYQGSSDPKLSEKTDHAKQPSQYAASNMSNQQSPGPENVIPEKQEKISENNAEGQARQNVGSKKLLLDPDSGEFILKNDSGDV